MRYLKSHQIFEAKGRTQAKFLIDTYLARLDTTRQDIIDIFQGVVDLGYQPKFKLVFIDKDGRERSEKSTAHETPLLTIRFESSKEKYIGGSVRFNNLDYLENLYHSLSMFMSMFKGKCNLEYDIDNMVELKLRLLFDTEYDDTKVSLTKDDILDALVSTSGIIPNDYESDSGKDYRSVNLSITPSREVARRLAKELKNSKDKEIDNSKEAGEIANNVIKEVVKILSKKLNRTVEYSDTKSGLFVGNQQISSVSIDDYSYDRGKAERFSVDIKRGFLKTDKCTVRIYPISIEIELT